MQDVGLQSQSQDESRNAEQPSARETGIRETLRSEAWGAYNQAFHSEEAETYRLVGRELYRKDLVDRIHDLFARSDEQNLLIEAHLKP